MTLLTCCDALNLPTSIISLSSMHSKLIIPNHLDRFMTGLMIPFKIYPAIKIPCKHQFDSIRYSMSGGVFLLVVLGS